MNTCTRLLLLTGAVGLAVLPTAQADFNLPRWTIDGGGAMFTTSGGGFELSGTIGQHDVGGPLTGGGFELTGGFWVAPAATPEVCPGDSNCDDYVSWRDIDFFVAGMNDDVAAWEAMFAPGSPTCPYANNDVNGDGTVSWRDIDALVAVMNTVCP